MRGRGGAGIGGRILTHLALRNGLRLGKVLPIAAIVGIAKGWHHMILRRGGQVVFIKREDREAAIILANPLHGPPIAGPAGLA